MSRKAPKKKIELGDIVTKSICYGGVLKMILKTFGINI